MPENIPKIIRSEARGSLVAVVYGLGGIGTFPEAVVLDVPSYVGPVFYADEPTWVPILPITAVKEGTRMTRTQFPVVAGYALTVHKAHGARHQRGHGRQFGRQPAVPTRVQARPSLRRFHALGELPHDSLQELAAVGRLRRGVGLRHVAHAPCLHPQLGEHARADHGKAGPCAAL